MSIIKTFRLLKREQPDPARVAKLFAKKSDEVLLGAIANPEHSEAARQILHALADQRGLQGAVGHDWAQTEESLYVAPFGRQPSFEEALAAPGRRRRIYRSLQIIMLLCAVGGLILFFQADPNLGTAGMVLFFGGLAIWFLGGIYSWLRPSRILLLRPFQSKKVSKPLKRFMNRNVSFHGHVITLADKYVKESLFNYVVFWIPRSVPDIVVLVLYLIPPIRQFKRWIRVSSAHSYGFLQNRLARRFTMNMFWQSAFTKLLKVKCSDTWWKRSVDLLMYSCHLIVVDLSWVKVGTEWELDKIDRRNLERKTVFVVSEDAADYAREVIARFWHCAEAPPPLYVYRNSGRLLEREAFERDIARMISESHLWHGVQAASV